MAIDGRLIVKWIIEKQDMSELDEHAMAGFVTMMLNLQVPYQQGISCLLLIYFMKPSLPTSWII
jgi:hypothetical protein